MKFFLLTIILVQYSKNIVLELNTYIRIDFEDKSYEEYIVEKLLGSGTHGCVYMCKNRHSKEIFAIKFIDCRLYEILIENEKNVYTNYKNEKILKFYKCGMYEQNISAFILEVGEKTLYDHLNNNMLEDVEKAILIRQVVLALSYLHLSGIIYNDLKSRNVMVFGKTECKLFDFGLSIKSKPRSKLYFIYIDDPNKYLYLSPEVRKKLFIDCKTDIWSLGVLIYKTYFKNKYSRNVNKNSDDKNLLNCIAICLQNNAFQRPSSSLMLYHAFFDRIFIFLDEIHHIKDTSIIISDEIEIKKQIDFIFFKYKNHKIYLKYCSSKSTNGNIKSRISQGDLHQYIESIDRLKFAFKISKYAYYTIEYNSNPMVPIIELEYNCVFVVEKLVILLKNNSENIDLIRKEIESLNMNCFEINIQEIFQQT